MNLKCQNHLRTEAPPSTSLLLANRRALVDIEHGAGILQQSCMMKVTEGHSKNIAGVRGTINKELR